jgi:DNA-binding response OmpR family regulator
MKLLVVEDEKALSKSICDYLRMEGNICEEATTFKDALRKIADNTYSCIILDIGLPDGSGLEIIRELKKNKSADRILILSAKSSLDDKLTGLNIGAARINSICRRSDFDGFNEMTFNEITIKINENQAFVNNEFLNLTRKEYDLLLFLMTNKDRIITKESIVEHLWGDNVILTDSFDFVYTHVKNLRKKLISKNCRNYIKVIYGFGYKFSDS